METAMVGRRLLLFAAAHGVDFGGGGGRVYPRARLVELLTDVLIGRGLEKRAAASRVRGALPAVPCFNIALTVCARSMLDGAL